MTQQKEYWTIETPEGEIVNFIEESERDAWWWLWRDYECITHDQACIDHGDTLDVLISEWKKEGYKAVKVVRASDAKGV